MTASHVFAKVCDYISQESEDDCSSRFLVVRTSIALDTVFDALGEKFTREQLVATQELFREELEKAKKYHKSWPYEPEDSSYMEEAYVLSDALCDAPPCPSFLKILRFFEEILTPDQLVVVDKYLSTTTSPYQ